MVVYVYFVELFEFHIVVYFPTFVYKLKYSIVEA